jgi:hypothetical protein
LILQGSLQTIADVPLHDNLEEKPYAPLFVVFEYLENVPKCNTVEETKIKSQNPWKMYSCKCLKIDKIHVMQSLHTYHFV